MTTVTVTVSFNTEKHARVLAWLDSEKGKRSEKIQRACEVACNHQGAVTLLDVLNAVQDLQRVGIITRTRDDSDDGDEPQEAARALEGLGL